MDTMALFTVYFIFSFPGAAYFEAQICGTGWIPYEMKCVKRIAGVHWVNITGAKLACRQLDADLVRVDSPEKEHFVKTTLLSDSLYTLIDKPDNGEEAKWTFYDETPMSYINWANNEPNGADTENCIELRPLGFNDLPCSSEMISHPIVCEKLATSGTDARKEGKNKETSNSYLHGIEIKSITTADKKSCILACLRDYPVCVSVNYRSEQGVGANCVLNKDARLDRRNGLTARNGWTYIERIFKF